MSLDCGPVPQHNDHSCEVGRVCSGQACIQSCEVLDVSFLFSQLHPASASSLRVRRKHARASFQAVGFLSDSAQHALQETWIPVVRCHVVSFAKTLQTPLTYRCSEVLCSAGGQLRITSTRLVGVAKKK